MKVTFRIVSIGERFTHNGIQYIKQSTRTARLVNYDRVFYIGQFEGCEV